MSRAREKRLPKAGQLPAALGDGARIACAVSRYHDEVTGGMLESALDVLAEAGVGRERVTVVEVPGTFELPLVAKRLAERADVAAVLCFGLVLKGETEHDRYIADACAQGLMQAALATDTPILFGVLTCSSLEQALARARRLDEGGLDKGREVALAALDVLAALAAAEGP